MKAATCSKVMAESSMVQVLIRWRLNEVMARHDIRAKELAEEMGVSPTTVSNLRKRNMPRLTEETLNKLCQALNKLSQEKSLITPGELIEYRPDLEPPNPKQQKNDSDLEAAIAQKKLKQDKDSIDNTLSSKRQPRHSLLTVIPGADGDNPVKGGSPSGFAVPYGGITVGADSPSHYDYSTAPTDQPKHSEGALSWRESAAVNIDHSRTKQITENTAADSLPEQFPAPSFTRFRSTAESA